MKNCGDIVHMHVAEKDLPHEMVKIVKKKVVIHYTLLIFVILYLFSRVHTICMCYFSRIFM